MVCGDIVIGKFDAGMCDGDGDAAVEVMIGIGGLICVNVMFVLIVVGRVVVVSMECLICVCGRVGVTVDEVVYVIALIFIDGVVFGAPVRLLEESINIILLTSK